MKIARIGLVSWIIISAIVSLTASAFSTNGNLSGQLLDRSGHAIPDTAIFVMQTGREQVIASTVTAQNGCFRFVSLPAGAITIRFKFKDNSEYDCQLIIRAAGELEATFIKEIDSIRIATHFFDYFDYQGTKQVESFDQSFIEKLPLARSFDAFLAFMPGVHSGQVFSTHGASERSNSYRVDGADLSSPFSGLIESNIPVESIKQMNFLMSGYSPAEEADGGAVIHVITASPGNKIHGNTAFYFEHSNFPKEIESLSYTKELKSYEPSFALGGSLINNKLWFFGSMDYLQRNYRNKPDRILPQETRAPLVITKLDFVPADQWKITAAYYGSFNNENHHFAPFTDDIDVREVNRETITADHMIEMQIVDTVAEKRFSAESVFSAGVSYFRQSIRNQPTSGDDGISTIADFTPGESALVQGSIVPQNYHAQDERLTVRNNFLFSLPLAFGRHELNIGFQYQHINMELQTAFNGGYFYGYSTISESIFRRTSFDQEGGNIVRDQRNIERISLNIADRWQLSRHFVIEVGLSVDKTNGGNDVANIFDWLSYSPRLAFVADPFGTGLTSIRITYARYHNRLRGIDIPGSPYSLKTDYLDASTGSFETSPLNTIEYFGFDPAQVDPDLKRPYWDEISLGIERRMNEQLTISTTALYRKKSNIVEDIETNLWSFYTTDIYQDDFKNFYTYYVVEPGVDDTRNPFFYLTNVDALKRDYLGIECDVKAALTPELMIFAGYTWSRTKGNIDNTLEESLFSSPAYDSPNERINSYGFLSSDTRNSIRLAAVYIAPRGISIAMLLRSDTGTPLNRLLLNPDLGKYQIRANERGTVYRTPGYNTVDLRVEKQFDVGSSTITFIFDVFNLAEDDTAIAFSETDEQFGIPIRVTEPRSYRWGIRFSF